MSNHCTNVICETCGIIYCVRCNRIDSEPDQENINVNINHFNTHIKEHNCNNCHSNTLYIF